MGNVELQVGVGSKFVTLSVDFFRNQGFIQKEELHDVRVGVGSRRHFARIIVFCSFPCEGARVGKIRKA